MKLLALQSFAAGLINRFRKDEDGLALTEYLVLLALLVAGIIVAVLAYGDAIELAWNNWASWATSTLGNT